MKLLSPHTHSVIGLIVGIALLLAPNIFGFSDIGGASVWIPRIIGIVVIMSELTVKGSFTGFGIVPMKMHIPTDVLMGALLALSPWLFGFSDEDANAWVPHIVVGVMMVGYALITRTNEEESSTPTS